MPAAVKHLSEKKLKLASLLARWPEDNLYYTATLVRCDKTNKRCLVRYEDGLETWANNRDLHIQLPLNQLNADEDIVCCVCDDGKSEAPNEIILCDVCQQGYHQKCHNPPVDSSKIDEGDDDTNDHKDYEDWCCATCSCILNQSNRAKPAAANKQQQQQHKHSTSPRPSQQQSQTCDAEQQHKARPPKSESNQTNATDHATSKQPVKVKLSSKPARNGATVEEMDPLVINVAKALAESDTNGIGTDDFMDVIAPELTEKKHKSQEEPESNGTEKNNSKKAKTKATRKATYAPPPA